MTIKLACHDYGFECDFVLEGRKSLSLLRKLREHFDTEHGIDYSDEAIIQMVVNRGHSRESIRNE
jgi:predicted small metal-binding protein